jgi:hypothetical protein
MGEKQTKDLAGPQKTIKLISLFCDIMEGETIRTEDSAEL